MRCYGNLALTVTSPVQSFDEPLSLAEVKTHLGLPERSPADDAEDSMIEDWITAARVIAEHLYGRDLVVKQHDLRLDYFPCEIDTLRTPLISVDLVQYTDSDNVEHTVSVADYFVDTARGVVMPSYAARTWPSFTPRPSSAVLVRHSAGFGSTDVFWTGDGKVIKSGMRELISRWFNGRLPYEGVPGATAPIEYPWGVTNCFSLGAVIRVR